MRIMRPLMTYCIFASIFSAVRPTKISLNSTTPTITPPTEPIPPTKDTPPITLAAMASNVYVKDLADNDEEVKATISTGVSINHVITIFIALFGGWIWETLGIETLFVASAILGLCNSAYAATIRTGKKA